MSNILNTLSKPIRKKIRKLQKKKLRAQLEQAYRTRNQGISGNSIKFRDKLEFNISDDCRSSYEHFCFINPPMVEEMDQFLKYSADKTHFLDIGALHGVFSLAFAAGSPERQTLSVDASASAFSFFMKNIDINPELNIQPVECTL